MIKYKVTIAIEIEKVKDWVKFMKEEHIRDVVNTGYFIDFSFHKINIIEKGKNDEWKELDPNKKYEVYEIEYLCRVLEDYHAYQSTKAEEMQRKHSEKYDGHFIAKRVTYSEEDMFELSPVLVR